MDTGEIVGAIKIKDGMFMGDEYSAQDLEFVIANKVTHVINTASKTVPNHWEPIGVVYLCYRWEDNDTQIILDSKDQISNETFTFIEDAYSKGESTLIHSIKGQSRSSTIIAAYLMRKYRWNLLKTLEFLNSRRPDLEIRANFIHQLSAYETRLTAIGIGPKTAKWTEVYDQSNEYENEELLLRNTYMNAQIGPLADLNVLNNKQTASKIKIPESNMLASDMPDEITIAKIRSEKAKSACGLIPIIKRHGNASLKSFANANQTRNFQISKERSFGKEDNKPTSYTYDALPIDKNGMKNIEKSKETKKYADDFMKPPINYTISTSTSQPNVKPQRSYQPPQPQQPTQKQPIIKSTNFVQPTSNALPQKPMQNDISTDPMLKHGLNQIYGIKEIPAFANIINSNHVNNYFIQDSSNVQVQAGATTNIFVQGVDPSRIIAPHKFDLNPNNENFEGKQPRSYSLQTKKEPVQTDKKSKDELTHFISKKDDNIKRPSPRPTSSQQKQPTPQKYINSTSIPQNVPVDKVLVQNYFQPPNTNAMSSFRTGGPIKATSISVKQISKIERPSSAAQKLPVKPQDKPKPKAPSAPHNRPSSPGLKGKIIPPPSYTASNLSATKTYQVTTYSKIRGMSPALKGNSINIASAIEPKPTNFVKTVSKQKWKS